LEPGTRGHADACEYILRTMGRSKIEVFRDVFGGDERPAVVANQAFEAAYRSRLFKGRVAPIAGAEAAIDALRAGGVKVCLTTGFSPATRDALIAMLGWARRIDLALSPGDCGRGRPYPDMILSAIIELAIDEVAAVAVAGDTSSDLLAGHRAGAAIVAGVLTGAHDEKTLAAAPHTHILDSVADLPDVIWARSDGAPAPVG
jgi:phosphonatase-like hydrolase